MSSVVDAPKPKGVNRIGLTLPDYKGKNSTLCPGCGHDAITSQIIKAFYAERPKYSYFFGCSLSSSACRRMFLSFRQPFVPRRRTPIIAKKDVDRRAKRRHIMVSSPQRKQGDGPGTSPARRARGT